MAEKKNAAAVQGDALVQELITRREQLRGWIRRLDEVRTEAPDRVAERVRADYEERLRQVTEELASHRDEIERGLEQLRTELAGAEQRLAQAVDALDETRLRHLIGELDEESWGRERTQLEAAVATAEAELGRTRQEVERLEVLAGEIAAEEPPVEEPAVEEPPAVEEAPPVQEPEPVAKAPEKPPEAGTPAAPRAPGRESPREKLGLDLDSDSVEGWDPFGQEFAGSPDEAAPKEAEDLPWIAPREEKPAAPAAPWASEKAADGGLEFLGELERRAGPEPNVGGELAPDDLAFLEELDRAISGTAGKPQPPPAPATPAPEGAAASRPGAGGERLLCKECGALNEPHAWYCEVCGSEL